MRPRALRTLGALVVALATSAGAAEAWEGLCRTEEAVGPRAGLGTLLGAAAFDHSVCAMHDEPRCEGGVEAARGLQLGEHADLTVRAMRAAGLPEDVFDPITLRYWASDVPVLGSALEPWAPAAAGGMRRPVERELFLAELGEGPDVSHSLSDFLLGNEHCFVPHVRAANLGELNACHEFKAHMGPINSTHWPLLAREVYGHLHAQALRVADRCRAMDAALDAATGQHPLAADMRGRVDDCEREALAMEAFASHYLEDAWSSGHMWNRWGPPVPPATDSEKLRAFLATAMVGLIHGSRGVFDQDDQMCMPGRFPGDPADGPVVEYRHGESTIRRPGGGDMYLDSCNAGLSGESVRGLEPLGGSEYDGMLACVALGFSEVYERTAQSLGPFQTREPSAYAFPGDGPTRSTDDACWDMRVTNESMVLGLGTMATGLGRVQAVDLTDPKFWSQLAVRYFVDDIVDHGEGNLGLDLPFSENDAAEVEFRKQTTRLAYAMLARVKGANARPFDTDLADGDTEGTQRFMGVRRSSEYVSMVRNDEVPYLERSLGASWNDVPSSSCEHDHDCPAGQFCDESVVVAAQDGTLTPQPACVPHEGGILRAFRDAEVLYWCDGDDLELARTACKNGQGCEACIELLLPHLRNACGPDDYVESAGGVDRRAMCDVLGAGEEADLAYGPYLDGDLDSMVRTASNLCHGVYGSTALTDRLHAQGHSDGPPADAQPAHLGILAHTGIVCGGEAQSDWLRFRHDPPTEDHVHTWAVRAIGWLGGGPGDAAQLDVQMFAGPGCAEGDRIDAPREVTDSNGDGRADTITLTQTVPAGQTGEVCFRVRGANRETYWHGFRFATDPYWLDH